MICKIICNCVCPPLTQSQLRNNNHWIDAGVKMKYQAVNFFLIFPNQRKRKDDPARFWALLFLASYSTNRNAVVFPLFTVYSLAWWAYAATIQRKFTACNEPAVTLPQRFPPPQSPSSLHRYSIGAKQRDSCESVYVTGATRIIHYNTLDELYFWRISGSLLWPDFPIQRPPIALPRHATISIKSMFLNASINEQDRIIS